MMDYNDWPTFDYETQIKELEHKISDLRCELTDLRQKVAGLNPNVDVPIDTLGLPKRMLSSLKRSGTETVRDILIWLDYRPDSILAVRNFGEKSLDTLIEALRAKNYII